VIDHVDHVMVYDTGSTDGTVEIVSTFAATHPQKITVELVGECDKFRHTRIRQDMLERTKTTWFMILDGDEVWPNRTIMEATKVIGSDGIHDCILVPYYNCVGDIFHDYRRDSSFKLPGRPGRLALRFIRMRPGVRWVGEYDRDTLHDAEGRMVSRPNNTVVLDNRFWHLTHLQRSSADNDVYSSGGTRWTKRRPTYFGIGRTIRESVPEVFDADFQRTNRINRVTSLLNFVRFAGQSLMRKIAWARE
jgi:glycosyltransferase involved in cell wall biosynthesis